MDLFSEASSGTRILTARHISAEKVLPEQNNAINTTLLCHSYSLQPNVGDYVKALHLYVWVLWPCALAVLIATCIIYVVTIRAAAKHWRECLTNVAVVLAVYPIVSAAGFIVLVVPRARIIAEAIAQEAVMIALYHLYCMTVAECGGVDKFVRRAGESRLETRVLPCCCWPCCVLPRPRLNKSSLQKLRYLVLQVPIIQALIYIVILLIWTEDMMLYISSFIYIQPFIAASILTGVWGIIMTVRAAESTGLKMRPRFLALQLALLIVKLQCGLAKALPEMATLPCIIALHPSIVVHMIQNCLMMLQMLLLSVWAWRLYRKPAGKMPGKVQQIVVAVVDDSAGADQRVHVDGKLIDNNGDLK